MIDKTSKIEQYKNKVKSILDYARGSNKNKIAIYEVEDDFAQFYEGQKLLPVVRDLGFDSITDFLKVCGFKVNGTWVSTISDGAVDSALDKVISLMQRTVPKVRCPDSFGSQSYFKTQTRKYLSSVVRYHQNYSNPGSIVCNNISEYRNTDFPQNLGDTPLIGSDILDKNIADQNKKCIDSPKLADPFIKPLPHLTRGSVLKINDYVKPDFAENIEYYYFQQYDEQERIQLFESLPSIHKLMPTPEKKNNNSSTSSALEKKNKVLWTIAGKTKNTAVKLSYPQTMSKTAYFLCRTMCEDTLALNNKLQIVGVNPVEAEAGTRCVATFNNTLCRGTIVDPTGRSAVIRLYDYDLDTVEVPWDNVYHAPNGVFSRNPLCAWILSDEERFELNDVVEVDFGKRLDSFKYRDYYDTKIIVRMQ
ncbi:hypothetical protein FO519_000459 [Halicephalobus sp. NKZ332]|nr:hypothetical protein FO519_000459 [Halicephalobus sp. NKZ332]